MSHVVLALDSPPLIYLTKAGFWQYISKLSYSLFTTEDVAQELKVDSAAFSEAAELADLFDRGIVKVQKAKAFKAEGISVADSSAISLAKKLKAVLVTDDLNAKLIAETIGVKSVHSTVLLISAVKRKVIGPEEALAMLDKMVEGGWYCDIATYIKIRKAVKDATVD